MTDEIDSISKHSDIHCPYCWAEINGIEEKFGKYFVYQSSISEKIIVLPVENPKDYLNLTWFGGINSFFSLRKGNQNIQKEEECPCCKRKFTLLVYPYEYNLKEKSNFDKFLTQFGDQFDGKTHSSIYDLCSFILNSKSDWVIFVRSLCWIILINAFMLLFILTFFVNDFNSNKQFIFDFFSLILIQAVFVVILKRHLNIVNSFYKSDELPYLYHQNYRNSKDFPFFKNLIYQGVNFTKKVRIPFLIYTIGVVVSLAIMLNVKFNLIQILSGDFLNNTIFYFSAFFFIFFILFFIIGFILGYFVFMSVITTIIFTRSIPLKILPFEKSQGLKLYEDFFFFSLIFTTILSVVIPICVNIEALYTIIGKLANSSSKYSDLIPLMLNGTFLYAVLIGIIVFTFLVILVRVTSVNISSQKSDALKKIAEKISQFRQFENPSIKDSLLISVLLIEHEKIERMSEYPFNKILFLFSSGLIYVIPILIGLIF